MLVLAIVLSTGSGFSADEPPSQVGQWSAPANWPVVAVHMSLDRAGNVLMFDGFGAALNSETIWNPTANTFLPVPYGRNLFCSGHLLLPDGRTLLVGGHISANLGLADTTLFNSTTNSYTRGPDMAVGRWYPTATQLPNDRVFVYSGDNIVQDRPGQPNALEDASVDSLPEVYNPTTNSWTSLPQARRTSPLYPQLFVLGDGRIIDVGPATTTYTISPGTWKWSSIATSPFDGMSAVMYQPNKIMKSGSWADPDFRGTKLFNTHGRTAVLDMNQPSPTWRETAPMNFPRAYHNLTLLPDGSVLASGGSTASDGVDLSKSTLPAEIWNPATETWAVVAPLQNGRQYHSTALLLPDGRVVMAGGGAFPSGGAVDQKNAEIYSPPYLFKGARPVVSAAPATTTYGGTFTITTPDASNIASVSLIRTPSVTHGLDMNQRFMKLNFTTGAGSLTVTAPPRASVAPAGDYLLYLVDTDGVPSVGRFLNITGPADTTEPTVSVTGPTGGSSVSGSAVQLAATSSDNDLVAGVTFLVDGTPVGAEDLNAPYTTTWDSTAATNESHAITAISRDPTGNTTTSATVNVTVSNVGAPPPPVGLVAAFGFDEGAGTATADQSPSGNNGTLVNATWSAAGKFGSAVSFNGTSSSVNVPDSNSLDLTSGMTLEAWVRPTANGGWRTVVFKEQPSYYAYALYSTTGSGLASGNAMIAGADRDVRGGAAVPLNTWTHLATTYNGSALTLYINGTQAATLPASGSIATSTGLLRIGGNAVWPEWFAGLIDEVRVYNRALTAAEIQTDMNTSISTPDSVGPSAPGTLTATGALGSVALSWGAATDNVGVANYNVHRSTAAGFTPSATNRIGQPTSTSYTDSGLAASTYYYRVTAQDAAGNVGPVSNEASGVSASDTAAPTVSISAPASGATVSGAIAVGATALDNGTVAGVQFRLDGSNLGAEDTTFPYSISWDTSSATNGSHSLTAVARDAAGNTTVSAPVSVNVSNTAPTGLVAAYGFDEGTGTSSADKSGTGNGATLSGTTWSAAGRFGNALSFNGTSSIVNVADATSLDLTNGMTVGAWVRPTATGSWRTVALKEATNYYAYGLYSNTNTNLASANAVTGGTDHDVRGGSAVPLNTWTHLAATYSGSAVTLYVNGVQAATGTAAGSITTSTGALRIGGNTIWGEYFAGLIDEVRVYNRALTAAQIQTDMNQPITSPDGTPPSAPGSLTGSASLSSVALSWSASTDNVGVTRYSVHRGTTAGFTPTAANRIAQPPGTTYNDTGLAAATYYYRVTAEDAVGNVSASSNEFTAVVTGDTIAPTTPSNLVATGALGSASVSWSGSTDNLAVTRYNVHRSTTPGFTPAAGNRVAQPSGTSYSDTGLAAATYYYRVTAEDAAGNVSAASNEADAIVTADTTGPTVSLTAPAPAATVSGTISVAASASDSGGVVGVQFRLDGTNLGSEDTSSPYSLSWDTTAASNGSHSLTAVARDAAGNTTTANPVVVTVSNTAPTGLVGAYGFDEGVGTTTADKSGLGNNGTLTNTSWSTAGKFGAALSFNGSSSWVTVADASSLDLTSGMTLEAWVRPTAGGSWRTVLLKEQPSYYAYGLYSNTGTNLASGNGIIGGVDRDLRGGSTLPLNTWTHLATTYDGSVLALYVNGTQVATLLATGNITASTGVLRIGGTAVWPEYFAGLIDEVRVYNRALTAQQIQTDMATSIGTPDTTAPTAPSGLAATGGLGAARLAWTGSTDDTSVASYNVHRSTTSDFTPTTANRIAQATGTSYSDSGLAAGTYYYRVTAQDPVGNVSTASNEASAAVTSDTTPPTVSLTAPAADASVSGSVSIAATASDAGGISGVQFQVDGVKVGAEDTSAPYSIAWDSRTVANGGHALTAVARDAAGNMTTSAGVAVTVSNTTPPPGLVAGFGFDEGSGTTTADSSGNANGATLSGPTWTIGKHGRSLNFDGTNDWVTVADSASLDVTSAITMEAWVLPSALGTAWRTVLFKEQTGDLVYGIYANRSSQRPNAQVFVGGQAREADGTGLLPLNTWSHLAATHDGSALRLYVNGALVATQAASGPIGTSSGVLRIGGNGIWPEFFAGRIDDVMVYNRALSQAEIQADMSRSAAPDSTAPGVTSVLPAASATNVVVGSTVSATFNEAIDPSTLTSSTFELRDATNTLVPTTISYDELTGVATLTPSSGLVYATTYTARLRGGTSGARVRDTAGNPLAADHVWTFWTEAPPPPILVIGSTANPFSTYTAEILRAEGLNEFSTLDISLISPAILSFYDVAILGDITLTAAQVTTLTNWLNGGGNLIALSPDPQLAGLLGLTSAGAPLAEGYVRIDTTTAPGAGLESATMQYHGSADRYTLNGATAVATLYSNAGTATTHPAVTLRQVGPNGGDAAAFVYDLARSVVLTRQGNPAWAGQDRDGIVPIRSNDLFWGARSGDVQPDWVNTAKMAIPQADEQQRLLANLILRVNRDRKPLPRFWYLPRDHKATVVMTGDDHNVGGTAGRFDQYIAASTPGCSVANWECIRGTSYIYPQSPLTNAQASSYNAQGFEVALHPQTGTPCANWTPSGLRSFYTTQLNQFTAKYTSIPQPATNRTHCVAWSDWLTMAEVERENNVRLDTNYYHYPPAWGSLGAMMTGSGFPMKFASPTGVVADIYQTHTHMNDEASQPYPATVDGLLDRALGTEGYFGIFTANMHTDQVQSAGSDAIVASAKARGVPVITAKQALDWVTARDASSFSGIVWTAPTLSFSVIAASGTNGLRAMVPATTSSGAVTTVTNSGSPVSFSLTTVKGIQYAVFPATSGAYAITYG